MAGVNGIVLTKLDGTARAAARQRSPAIEAPDQVVGVGEAIDDLIPFSRRITSTRCSKKSGS